MTTDEPGDKPGLNVGASEPPAELQVGFLEKLECDQVSNRYLIRWPGNLLQATLLLWTSFLLHEWSPWRPFPNNHLSRGSVCLQDTHSIRRALSVSSSCPPLLPWAPYLRQTLLLPSHPHILHLVFALRGHSSSRLAHHPLRRRAIKRAFLPPSAHTAFLSSLQRIN